MTLKCKLILLCSIITASTLSLAAFLFLFNPWERRIVGDYRLEQWEDFETYYLSKHGQDDSSGDGGVIGGTVIRLGWNNRHIFVERHSIFRGDPDGWMIIDVQSGAMTGPFTEAEFQAQPESRGVQIFEASEAWKKL